MRLPLSPVPPSVTGVEGKETVPAADYYGFIPDVGQKWHRERGERGRVRKDCPECMRQRGCSESAGYQEER